ncbi:LamG-like jellyroll fold domain-containing protein [Flavobacterium sp.]|uniref:LamG-like jellyroll fold domain-containing protein n=1 Tax=Flavobacterium sp. TaxID=239 RepID=UPI0037523944
MKNFYLSFCLILSIIVSAQSGSHLNFDGSNDLVLISGTSSPITTSYSKEAWISCSSFGVARDFISGNATGQNAFWVANGFLTAGHNGASGGNWSYVIDSVPLLLNVWYHVAVTYDATTTTMKLYKNGILIATNTNVPVASNTATSKLYIGCYSGNNSFFMGNIDEVRIWNRILTPTEIFDNKNCEFTTPQTGMIAYYKFNQGINNANNAGVTTLLDSSTNVINATLTNFALVGLTSNWASGSPVNCLLNLSENNFNSTIKIYPNPVNNTVTINLENYSNSSLEILDFNSRLIHSSKLQLSENEISMDDFSAGIYFFKIKTDKGVFLNKVIKN